MPSETKVQTAFSHQNVPALIKPAFPASLTRTGLNGVTVSAIMASPHPKNDHIN
ncbi:TPA: hypothetical protein ACE7JA_001180 [Neisseria gonorrhoeae]